MFDKSPLAPSGWAYVLGALFLALVATSLSVWLLAVPLWGVFAMFTWFFRDPKRDSGAGPRAVLSPADGKVVAVEEVDAPELPGGRGRVVSIFMDLFNVHVNRAPIEGEVLSVTHLTGRYMAADKPAARQKNERMIMVLANQDGKTLAVAQVAGLVARHIECWTTPGSLLERGQRYGMIRFGSRLDVYLPLDAPVNVKPGQKVKAGITPIGEL